MGPRIRTLLEGSPDGKKTTARGWVRTRRDSKELCFLEINDGSCLRNLQVIVDLHISEGISEELARAGTGASVEVSGILVESPGKNQALELQAETLRVIGEAPQESYPLQKKRHSFEFLREIAHLRPRTNTFGAVARVRNTLSYAIHSFFQERGFVYVHTPIITASDSEGAGEMFQVTTLPLEGVPMKEDTVDYERDFFGKRTALTVSGQLEAEIYALALKDVYTFGPTFRAENSNTTRHLAEFWMIEPEMAFCDIHGNMDTAEDFLKYLLSKVLTDCREDMEFFDKWVQPGLLATLEKLLCSTFTRISYTTAVEALEKAATEFEFAPAWGKDLQSEHEKYLTEVVYGGPVIVTDYPREIKAFYMKQNDDGKTVRGMDVLVPRLGEIIGGSERESDLGKLESRMQELGLPMDDYWWYLELRKYGSAPHSGFGLGFERLVQYVTGMQNIRDVIPFPRSVNNAEF
ncbi:MAG TPA: asparagine--tRNA ligase [Spirochaetia bacterium]|nr:asparagine--tRNA ligase [Spirochaetia bacterium]